MPEAEVHFPSTKTVAVLMATHDRPAVTEAAVEKLLLACAKAELNPLLFITSSSGNENTIRKVSRILRDVTPLRVHKDSFWAESMRIAWLVAKNFEWDYLLWLNDDSMLFEQGLSELQKTVESGPAKTIGIGSFCDPLTRKPTYGLAVKGPWYRPLKLSPIFPDGQEEVGDVGNGNAVLMSRRSALDLEGFPKGFKHNLADIFFSLNATSRGYSLRTPAEFVGTCGMNPEWGDWALSPNMKTRMKGLFGKKGIPPRSWIPISLRFGGIFGLFFAISPYLVHIVRGLIKPVVTRYTK